MEKDTARSWIIVVVLGLAVGVAFLDRVLLSVATPTIMREFGIDATLAGILLAAFFWSYTIMQLPSGWMIDRYGTKRVMAVGYILWSLSCIVTGWVSSLTTLLACRLGLGIGELPVYPSGYRLVSTAFSERNRALASAIYSEGSKVGPAIGAPLAAGLIVAFGWRNMFVIVGLMSLLWLIPWLIVAPSRQDDVGEARSELTRAEWMELLSKREIWGVMIGYFGYLYVFYVYVTWLPSFLIMDRGFTILKAGWFSAIPFLVQLVFGLAGAWASDRFIHNGYSPTLVRKTAIGLGLIVGLAIVPAGFVNSGEMAVFLFGVSLAGLGVAVPNMLAVPSALAPENRGGVVGAIQNTGGNLGGVVAPVITGVLYDATHSFAAALIVAGAMLVVCAIGYLLLIPRIEMIKLGGVPSKG